jgi:pyruvate-formate lyase
MCTRPTTMRDDSILEEISNIEMEKRVRGLRDAYFRAVPEVCTERARLVTELSQPHFRKGDDGQYQPTITGRRKAELYKQVLLNRKPVIWPAEARELRRVTTDDGEENRMVPFPIAERSWFAGGTTSRFKGVPLYPEFIATWIWPELDLIQQREKNPYYLFGSKNNLIGKDVANPSGARTEDELEENDITLLNQNVFPFWIDKNITELGRARARAEAGVKGDTIEFELLQNLVFYLTTKPNCISHTIPNFQIAVDKGLKEIIRQAKEKRGGSSLTEAQQDFYDAVVASMEGIIGFSQRLADEASRLAAQTKDPDEKRELHELAAIHARIPAEPAETFREGLTTLWMCWIALHIENANAAMSLGRLDQLLYPLYQKGLTGNAGNDRKWRKQAVELLCCFWLKIGDHVPMVPSTGEKLFGGTGSNQAITIGGVKADGSNAVNELTYVILQAIELMRLRDPNLNARYHPEVNDRNEQGEPDDRYLRRLCEVNLNTGATPALHNDRAVIEALTRGGRGETQGQANDYGIVGCVEPVSNGRTYGHTGAVLLNLVSALELTLFGGKHRLRGLDEAKPLDGIARDVASCQTFGELRDLFLEHVAWLVERTVRLNNLFGRIHQGFYPTPILSSLFEGPMDKGKDVIDGGATFNSSGVAIIGFADVVDSLAALEQWVFGDREWARQDPASGPVSIPDACSALLDSMQRDFGASGQVADGQTEHAAAKRDRWLLATLRNPDKTPKFGNGDGKAQYIARWLVESLDRLYATCDPGGNLQPGMNYRGGRYRVGYWSMTNHAGFGRLSYSTPNGRRKGENFASGITPVSGVTGALSGALGSVANLPVARCPVPSARSPICRWPRYPTGWPSTSSSRPRAMPIDSRC